MNNSRQVFCDHEWHCILPKRGRQRSAPESATLHLFCPAVCRAYGSDARLSCESGQASPWKVVAGCVPARDDYRGLGGCPSIRPRIAAAQERTVLDRARVQATRDRAVHLSHRASVLAKSARGRPPHRALVGSASHGGGLARHSLTHTGSRCASRAAVFGKL